MVLWQYDPNEDQVRWYDAGNVDIFLECRNGDGASCVDDGRTGVVPATAILACADPKSVERVGTLRDSPDDGTRH